MNYNTDKRFYLEVNHIKYIYPCQVKKTVAIENLGPLSEYVGKKYTLKEISEIMAILVTKMPYVSGSMALSINVMGIGYHQMLNIKNYFHDEQDIETVPTVRYLF